MQSNVKTDGHEKFRGCVLVSRDSSGHSAGPPETGRLPPQVEPPLPSASCVPQEHSTAPQVPVTIRKLANLRMVISLMVNA